MLSASFLQLIVPLCGSLRVFYRNHEDVANVPLFMNSFCWSVSVYAGTFASAYFWPLYVPPERAERHGRHRLVRRIKHETRNLLCCQAGSKVCGALLNGKRQSSYGRSSPVFSKSLKYRPSFFDELYAGRRRPRERLAVFRIGTDNAVFFHFLRSFFIPLCLD